MSSPIRIGFVPEHFSTPLHFAQQYFSLNATLIPFPSGTGHMIQALQANEIDIGIGLTEGWIAGLGRDGEKAGYKLVGTYVKTPLCWAISIGADSPITSVSQLKDTQIGVSRIGSGSHIMSFVLADTHNWLDSSSSTPFTVVPLQTFANLRNAVNTSPPRAEFFMWEHFTSKKYYDNHEIKRIGEIYTPWSSWKIVAQDKFVGDEKLEEVFRAIDKGVEYFTGHSDEAVKYISSELDYSVEDAREWLGTVEFAEGVRGVEEEVVGKTIEVLRKAGVVKGDEVLAASMIGISRTHGR